MILHRKEKLIKLSAAVSLTVMEIDFYPNELIPAFLLADLMSPALWVWRSEKSAYNNDGDLLSPRSRLNHIQRFFHRYTFTNLPNEPGGDCWGLLEFRTEEDRFGSDFVRQMREEYDETLKQLLAENPESQFGQIVNQPYYRDGFFPRLKNETLEVMNAFSALNPEGKRSGKCAGLGMLWAAALAVWGRFPLDRIIIIGNRAHVFVFLDVEDGHLLNNTKWFSSTRINNRSELSEFVRTVTSSPETTFFYNPVVGMCHCLSRVSQIPRPHVTNIYNNVSRFVSNPLRHPHPDHIQFIEPTHAIPDPLHYDSAGSYQAAIVELAKQHEGSIYELALYAFRWLDVSHPPVYVQAAMRDYHVKRCAAEIHGLPDALSMVAGITGGESIFESRNRIAMPDETLFFQTGSNRDKALLLYTLLRESIVSDDDSLIGFSDESSFVFYQNKWIDLRTLSTSSAQPCGLKVLFNDQESSGEIIDELAQQPSQFLAM